MSAKIKLPKRVHYLTSIEAQILLEENGINLTKEGMLYAGLKNGFVMKGPDNIHWVYDRRMLTAYINSRLVNPDKGWITAGEASKKYEVNLFTLYYGMKKGKIPCKRYWTGGKLYVEEQGVRNYFKFTESPHERKKD